MIDKKTQKVHKTKWEPKRSIVSKIRKTVLNEYKKSSGVIDIYGNLEKPSLPQQFDKFTELAAFLMDSEQTVKQLVKLNAMLVKKAKKLGLIDINTSGNFILASYKKDESYRPHRKLLRSVLEEELKRFGFGSEFVKLIGFVPPTVFREMLRNKLIPKDSGVSPHHGEYTHALQWLMIAWQHEDTGSR